MLEFVSAVCLGFGLGVAWNDRFVVRPMWRELRHRGEILLAAYEVMVQHGILKPEQVRRSKLKIVKDDAPHFP